MSGRNWPRRLAWMAGLWCLGVAAVGAAALLLRLLMSSAGMTTPS